MWIVYWTEIIVYTIWWCSYPVVFVISGKPSPCCISVSMFIKEVCGMCISSMGLQMTISHSSGCNLFSIKKSFYQRTNEDFFFAIIQLHDHDIVSSTLLKYHPYLQCIDIQLSISSLETFKRSKCSLQSFSNSTSGISGSASVDPFGKSDKETVHKWPWLSSLHFLYFTQTFLALSSSHFCFLHLVYSPCGCDWMPIDSFSAIITHYYTNALTCTKPTCLII